MSSRQQVEQLAREIEHAFESGKGYKFGDDPYNLEEAVFSEDFQLLSAFLPVVGKWRLANLMELKKMLQQNGYKDNYGQYLTDDCLSTHIEFLGIVSNNLGIGGYKEMSALYVLAMTSNEADRERLRYLVGERKIMDVDDLKEALKSMGNAPPAFYSGTL